MADIELVIRIPEEYYNDICNSEMASNYSVLYALDGIRNGTPLPKGHGRLIDADAFIARMVDTSKRCKYKEMSIDDCLTVDDVFQDIIASLRNRGLTEGDSPTIIEADK